MGSALLAAISQGEELSRDEAGRVYRRLLEKQSADPKSVEQMKAAMDVLGLTLTDASQHLRLREQAKQLQQRITAGAGLDDAQHKASKAVSDWLAERSRLLTEWQRRNAELHQEQSEITDRYQGAVQAVRQLRELQLQHAVALADLACCSESDLDKPDPLNQSK